MLKIILISLLTVTPLFAGTKMDAPKTSFSDVVKGIRETKDGLDIQLDVHAAVYRLEKKNPKFEAFKKLLNKSKDEKKEINLTAQIPTMEILEIK